MDLWCIPLSCVLQLRITTLLQVPALQYLLADTRCNLDTGAAVSLGASGRSAKKRRTSSGKQPEESRIVEASAEITSAEIEVSSTELV